jgi:CBS domain-containing protein
MITLGAMIKSAGRGVFSVGSQQTVFEALEFMADKNIGAVLVIDDGVLVGIFSERDYARKVVLAGRSSQTTLVREVMVTSLITIEAGEPLDHCMQLMTDHRIRHLPVFASGQLIGVISIGDVVRQMIIEQRQLIDQLEAYIRG